MVGITDVQTVQGRHPEAHGVLGHDPVDTLVVGCQIGFCYIY